MDQSEQQGNEQGAAGTTVPAQEQAAPVKAPRKRRTASAPAGAPPAVPVAETPASETPVPAPEAEAEGAAAAPARKRATRVRKSAVAATQDPTPADTALDSALAEHAAGTAGPETAEQTVVTAAPARAPRARRRAATAEAGPARTPDAAIMQEPTVAAPVDSAPAVDAGPVAPAEPMDAPDPAASAADDAETPDQPVRARRSPTRGRSRRASEPAAPEPVADQGAADQGTAGRTPAEQTVAAGEAATEGASPAPGDTADAAAPEETGTRPAEDDPRPRRSVRRRPARGAAAAQETQRDEATTDAPESVEPEGTAAEAAAPEASVPDPFAVPESPLSLLFHAPDLSTVTVPSVQVTPAPEDDVEDDAGAGTEDSGRRSRRSRRGRSRNRGGSASAETATDENEASESSSDPAGPEDGADVTSRRRRRRRRGDQDLELTGGEDDDPPNTVTRVRAPRQNAEPVSDRVTSVRGSTRLEAKKQRRRESRDTGRRRHVITEAEFLARRESVDRQMIVRQRDDRIQIGVLEDGILAEHFVSNTQQDSLIGNVYVGKVQNVLPSMEAAFIDIGRGRNAVLYAGEVNWDAAGLDGQPRRIELALKSGDPVLVQVTKDPVGHKGARLTSQISLPGRYLVYVPGGSMTGISRKLPDVERNRLKRILKDRLPENAGVIVRTAAEGASEEELTHDINRLRAQWEEIERKAGSTKTLPPELLYGEPDLTIKVVRDVFNEDFSKLMVSGEEAWDTIEAYVMYVAPDLVGRLEKWTGEEDIFAASRIDEQISKALDRKVFLPSGGSLVIDRTEAMTVVDVNTGKFTGSGGNLEETVTKNNLEAAEEVVRQLRLRDIGGIIVIDFIDMVLEANRDLVLRRLVECLGRDRTKHQVAEVTSLGLVQMTRKRMGTGLLEVFGEDCEHCAGRGVVTHLEPVEHRHSTTTSEHQQQARQDRPSRSERKRNRGRNGQQQDEVAQPTPAPEDDAERTARAEAARAALASIAAATHHAHGEAADHPASAPEVQVTEAVLTINGETVSLPRADDRRSEEPEVEDAPTPRLTLDSLSEAFNRKPADSTSGDPALTAGPEEVPAQDDEPDARHVSADGTEEPAVAAPPARRTRARRVARSAQGAADTAIETQATDAPAEGTGTRHVAKAAAVQRAAAPAGAEPIMFGVGVPASEL